MNEKQIQRLVQDYLERMLQLNDEYRVGKGSQLLDCGDHLEPAIPYSQMIADTTEDMLSGTYERIRPLVGDFLEERGVDVGADSPEYSKLLRDISLAHIEALEIDYQRDLGNFSDRYYKATKQPVNVEQHTAEEPAAKNSGVTFWQLCEIYIKEKTTKNEWKGKTETQNIARLNLLAELIGEGRAVQDITRPELIQCLQNLQMIPTNRNKIKEYAGKTIVQLVKMKVPENARLSLTSVKHHMELLSTLFKFAVRSDYLDKNYAEGLAPRTTTKASDERQVYDKEDLQRVVDFTFKKEAEPSKKWIPLLAMFTGMRLEEICQLYKRDIQDIDGVWCIKVTDSDEQTTKTQAGNRTVPIHSKLIGLGFLKYVEKVKHDRLWPELERGRDGYSDAFGKWYQRLNRGYITSNKKKVFHCFRHTVITQLVHNEVADSTIKEIVGHSKEGVTRGRYAKELPPAITKKAVDTLDYGIKF